jgi:hypothetical protein
MSVSQFSVINVLQIKDERIKTNVSVVLGQSFYEYIGDGLVYLVT